MKFNLFALFSFKTDYPSDQICNFIICFSQLIETIEMLSDNAETQYTRDLTLAIDLSRIVTLSVVKSKSM